MSARHRRSVSCTTWLPLCVKYQATTGPTHKWHTFFNMDNRKWIQGNLTEYQQCTERYDWPELLSTCCWFAWRWRNLQIHNAAFKVPWNALAQINSHLHNYRQRWSGYNLQEMEEPIILVSWSPPPSGLCVLNGWYILLWWDSWLRMSTEGYGRRMDKRLLEENHGKKPHSS